jgi:hypothetical protein
MDKFKIARRHEFAIILLQVRFLRVEITLIRVEITLVRVEIILSVEITLRVEVTPVHVTSHYVMHSVMSHV